MDKKRCRAPNIIAADLNALEKELLARFEEGRPTAEVSKSRPRQAIREPIMIVRGK